MPLVSQTRYAGPVPDCAGGTQARATLVRVHDRFSFTPSDGTLVISGSVAPDGSFTGSLAPVRSGRGEPGQAGAPAPRFTLTVSGRLDRMAASGTYATPRCSTNFRLPRIDATLLP
jgi:hypothetical protein